MVEIQICAAMLRRAKNGLPYIIVLGAQVRKTVITNSLKRRLDAALFYLKKNPHTQVIVSGGQGKGEDISEAAAMSEYLYLHGIDKRQIILEDTSTSTRENLKNSSKIIGNLAEPVGIITNGFHMYRALQIGRKLGFMNIQGIAATSNPILQINYLMREFFAVIWLKIS
ncbi:MAG: YdcF family protein [Muricomes sp.]